jgi:hypothetical protein
MARIYIEKTLAHYADLVTSDLQSKNGMWTVADGRTPSLRKVHGLQGPVDDAFMDSGHTFGDADFRGTNAWLYPRLGDYAVLSPNGDVAVSGFFDENWQLRQSR